MANMEHPKTIDKYRIDSVLGRGAMGVVYKAYDSEIDRFVAIKILHNHLLDGDMRQELEVRFKHEVKAAAKCLHQNIVTIFDFGVCAGKPYMVMEFVQGVDLRLMLKAEHQFSFCQAIGIVTKVLDALFAAHQLGIVHRDIKPANILLLESGLVKVADFGVARIDSSDLTQIGDVIGTPSYMSPEAKRGDLVDSRSDIYSTALVLFELLTGKRLKPHDVNAENIFILIQELDLTPSQSYDLSQTLINALEKEPQNRYQKAVDFSKALIQCQTLIDDPYRQASELAETVIHIKTNYKKDSVDAVEKSQVSCLSALAKEDISQVEKSLTKYVGPIARVLLKKQAKEAVNIEGLLDSLATNIPSMKDREEFLTSIHSSGLLKTNRSGISNVSSMQGSKSKPSQSNMAYELSETELDKLTAVLVAFLGPVAKHIIKKTVKSANSKENLLQLLADKIPDSQQRAAFLKKCGS